MTFRYFLCQDKTDFQYEVFESDLDLDIFRDLLKFCVAQCPEGFGDTELVGQIGGAWVKLDASPVEVTLDHEAFAGYHDQFPGYLPEAFKARCVEVLAEAEVTLVESQDALLKKLNDKVLPS